MSRGPAVGKVSVRWGKNWRLRLAEARAIVPRAHRLDVDRHVERHDMGVGVRVSLVALVGGGR